MIKLREYDAVRYLDSEEMIEEYLLAFCEDGTPLEIACALGRIAHARAILDLAHKTGLSHQALFEILKGETTPEFSVITKIAAAMGLHLSSPDTPKNKQDAA